MVKASRGSVPPAAQRGLKDGLRSQGLFLSCQCVPTEELEVERHGSSEAFASRVEQVEPLADNVLRVRLTAPVGLRHRAGQFIQLERPSDGLVRAYSVASLPGASLELHVALLPGGAMSQWLQGAVGEPVVVRGPFGECFYLPEEPERPLCLAGSGTGLAPLLGVLRAALAARHRAPIRLYHGSVRSSGLYLWGELCALARSSPALQLVGSVLEGPLSEPSDLGGGSLVQQPLDVALFARGAPSSEERAYLCGAPELVRSLQRKLYMAGVSLERIHADAFVAPGARA
ncbi:MAG: ferredoxin reductase [Pseudomonadota bacterium]|jgi:ferredoxin-NADP reductase